MGFVENLFEIDSILNRLDKLETAMNEVTNAVNVQKKMIDLQIEYNERTERQIMNLMKQIDDIKITLLGKIR